MAAASARSGLHRFLRDAGLKARARLNDIGDDETGYLTSLREIVARGKTPAEMLLERFHGAWGGDMSRLYDEESY